jgi:uncharacterized protein (DUF433 family)
MCIGGKKRIAIQSKNTNNRESRKAMKLQEIVHISNDILGGTPVFRGTRVPVSSLFEHLQSGISLTEFLEDFPSVNRELAEKVIELSKLSLLSLVITENYYENTDRRKSA